jgi:hypothetical protein
VNGAKKVAPKPGKATQSHPQPIDKPCAWEAVENPKPRVSPASGPGHPDRPESGGVFVPSGHPKMRSQPNSPGFEVALGPHWGRIGVALEWL